MQRVFAIGTCRVHEPLVLLRRAKKPAGSTWHRVHTPTQILQLVRHLNGEDVFDAETVKYLSVRGYEAWKEQRTSKVLDDLAGYRAEFAKADALIIEVSSFREFWRAGFCVDPMVHYHLGGLPFISKARLRPRDAADVLATIRRIADRPVLWACHLRPVDEDPAYEAVHKERLPIATTVEQVAVRFDDLFFDPTVVLRELGQSVAMQSAGSDLAHFSEHGTQALARHYGDLLWPPERRQARL